MYGLATCIYMTVHKKISEKSIKNEVGCSDDTMPKTVDTRRHRRLRNPIPTSWFLRVAEDCCMLSTLWCLLVSAVFGTVSSLHSTSFLMTFILVYTKMCKCITYSCMLCYVMYVYTVMYLLPRNVCMKAQCCVKVCSLYMYIHKLIDWYIH